MARTLFFRMVLRKFSEITNNKPIFSQYNIFYNYKYLFFQSAFWSLFNHRQKSQSNQEQCSLCCSSPCFSVLLCTHYVPLQYFSAYFLKLKEIGVLRPIFPDYIIFYDYELMLVKFSKQIGNSFEETINTKVSSKPCQTSEMKFFLQVVTCFRGELRILQTSKMELFAKIVKN